MVDIFPRRNLPPLAEQWGREVENRIVSSETGIETLQQGLSGQNRNTASSLAVIAQQIQSIQDAQADLLGRVSYYHSGSDTGSWTTTQANNQAFGPTLSFTLSEPRTVTLSFLISGTARIASLGGAGSGYSAITPTLFLNGSRVGANQPGLTVVLPGGTAVRSSEVSAPLQARTTVSLSAGTHDFRGGFQFRQVVQTSGSGVIGFVSTQDPQLYVDVAQQTG